MRIFSLTLLLIIFYSCADSSHFISDANERAMVENDYMNRPERKNNDTLFDFSKTDATEYEKQVLTFLYAYMPLSDVADYSFEYYLKNIRSSLKAKEEMPWGKEIPEMEFRHFVLPVRVNNENLDESRMVFYDELKNRVRNLSLRDAVLEVNHWCHEKVVYTPSDSRTSSPLASVKTA